MYELSKYSVLKFGVRKFSGGRRADVFYCAKLDARVELDVLITTILKVSQKYLGNYLTQIVS